MSQPPQTLPAPGDQRRRELLIELMDQFGMLVVLVLLAGFCAVFVKHFAEPRNLANICYTASGIGIVGCTMLFCLASGNVDLSVGTIIPCAGVVAAMVTNRTDHYAAGILAALALGTAIGLFNGVVVALLRLNPLITTLATMQMVKGLGFLISRNEAVFVSDEAFTVLGQGLNPVWLCTAFFVVFGLVLSYTTYGRNTLAIGGNEEAARLAGVPVKRTKVLIFAVQGFAAAVAGILIASKTGIGQQKQSEGIELQIIAACVLGGVSLSGGIGRMSYVVAGVLIMGVAQNAMDLQRIDNNWQYVVSGAVLLAAIIIDRLKPKR